MFRNCLDCREHMCIKGIDGKTERVAAALEQASAQLRTAQAAADEGVYGAADWVASHLATVERLDQLLGLLRDPAIEDGAVIQLSTGGTDSLSEGAARDQLVSIDALRLAAPTGAASTSSSRKSHS